MFLPPTYRSPVDELRLPVVRDTYVHVTRAGIGVSFVRALRRWRQSGGV